MDVSPSLLIISGPPCTGKTTLAAIVGRALGLPMLSKDAIKETLFDTVGWSDRAWSQKLGLASVTLLFQWIEQQLTAGQSVGAECNFHRDYDAPKFAALTKHYGCDVREIFCTADPAVIVARFMARWHAGERHPGHAEDVQEGELRDRLAAGIWQPICPPAHTLVVDTTDWAAFDPDHFTHDARTLFTVP